MFEAGLPAGTRGSELRAYRISRGGAQGRTRAGASRASSACWGLGVTLEQVCERYHRRWALDGVSLTVAPGEIVALTGAPANGAGALLKLIATNIAPRSGAVRLIGQAALQAVDWDLFRARSIAHLTAPDPLLGGFSVRANLEGPLMGAHRDWHERRERLMATLESFDLQDVARSLVASLEPRVQARVRLAMALSTRPRLLLVDRPATRAAARQIVEALALHASLRGGDRDPTVIIASERVEAQRTIEIPYRAVGRKPLAAQQRGAPLATGHGPGWGCLRAESVGASGDRPAYSPSG